jgi:hypothetical protein
MLTHPLSDVLLRFPNSYTRWRLHGVIIPLVGKSHLRSIHHDPNKILLVGGRSTPDIYTTSCRLCNGWFGFTVTTSCILTPFSDDPLELIRCPCCHEKSIRFRCLDSSLAQWTELWYTLQLLNDTQNYVSEFWTLPSRNCAKLRCRFRISRRHRYAQIRSLLC